MPCYDDSVGNLRCGYSTDPSTLGSDDSSGGGSSGDIGGGFRGSGGDTGVGSGDIGGGGGSDPSQPPSWEDIQKRMDELRAKAGEMSPEMYHSYLEIVMLQTESGSNYYPDLSPEQNYSRFHSFNVQLGRTTNADLLFAIQNDLEVSQVRSSSGMGTNPKSE